MLEVASAKIDRFGWANMDKNLKDALCKDWCDVLGQYTLAEVKKGISDVFHANKGKLRSINEHQVVEQIRKQHQHIIAMLPRQADQPQQVELTPEEIERRKQVSAEVMASFKGFPREQTEQETQDNINAAKDAIERGEA